VLLGEEGREREEIGGSRDWLKLWGLGVDGMVWVVYLDRKKEIGKA